MLRDAGFPDARAAPALGRAHPAARRARADERRRPAPASHGALGPAVRPARPLRAPDGFFFERGGPRRRRVGGSDGVALAIGGGAIRDVGRAALASAPRDGVERRRRAPVAVGALPFETGDGDAAASRAASCAAALRADVARGARSAIGDAPAVRAEPVRRGDLPHEAFADLQLDRRPAADGLRETPSRDGDRRASARGALRKVVLARHDRRSRPDAALGPARCSPRGCRSVDPDAYAFVGADADAATLVGASPELLVVAARPRGPLEPARGLGAALGRSRGGPRQRRRAGGVGEGPRGARDRRRGGRGDARPVLRGARMGSRARAAAPRRTSGTCPRGSAARCATRRRPRWSSSAALHPTPAVGGTPRAAALAAIARARAVRPRRLRGAGGMDRRRGRRRVGDRPAVRGARRRPRDAVRRRRHRGRTPIPTPSSTRPSGSSARSSTRSAGADGVRTSRRAARCQRLPRAAATARRISARRARSRSASIATWTTWRPPASNADPTRDQRRRALDRVWPTPARGAQHARSTACGVTNSRSSSSAGSAPCPSPAKICPPALSFTTTTRSTPAPRVPEQRAGVVEEREVAEERDRRAGAGRRATPSAVDTRPSIPLAPRFAEHAEALARRHERVEVAHRRRVADEQRAAVGSSGSRRPADGRDVARDPHLGRLVPRRRAARRRRARDGVVGRAPRVEPAGRAASRSSRVVRDAASNACGERAGSPIASRCDRDRGRGDPSSTTTSRSAARDERLRRPRGGQRRRPGARPRARALASHASVAVRSLPGRISARVRRRVETASARVGSASSGHPQRSRQRRRLAPPRGRCRPARAVITRLDEPRTAPRTRSRAGADRVDVVRRARRRPVARRRVQPGSGPGVERLVERAVDVDRARGWRSRRSAARSRRGRGARATPRASCAPAAGTGGSRYAPHVAPVQLDLVDRLVRAGAAEPRWTIGRQQDRAARATGTPRRRRGRAPRRPCRSCTRPRPARAVAFASPSAKNALERSSRCTCTVTAGCRASASASGVDREPGERHACAHPAAHQLVHERPRARERGVGRGSRRRRVPGSEAERQQRAERRRRARPCPTSTGISSRPVAVPDRVHRPDRERPRDQRRTAPTA